MKIVRALVVIFLVVPVSAQSFRSVQIDQRGAVRGVTSSGKHLALYRGGKCRDARVSRDSHTVAWFQVTKENYRGWDEEVFRTIRWFRKGRVRSFSANPFGFSTFWFVDGGRRIGVNLGPRHGPGVNVLLDASTGKELESFPDVTPNNEPRPKWLDTEPGT